MPFYYDKVVLEGTDLIGKTTLREILWHALGLREVEDRRKEFSDSVGVKEIDWVKIRELMRSESRTLFILLYSTDESILTDRLKRLQDADSADEYDVETVAYNKSYREVAIGVMLDQIQNCLAVDVTKYRSPYDIAVHIISQYIRGFNGPLLEEPEIEGESKRIWRVPGTNLGLAELKPTLYSFTHNRYGEAPGTDVQRLRFWEFFCTEINRQMSMRGSGVPGYWDEYKDVYGASVLWANATKKPLSTGRRLPTSFLGTTQMQSRKKSGMREFAIVEMSRLPPIEVVWKNYMVGTMKHTLKGVDQHQLREPLAKMHPPIQYEGKLPRDIIRFDWRNELPDGDLTIPEDFAAFYIDVEKARATATLVTYFLREILGRKGYELVDLCYFMNEEGDMVCSEISPDGMRIRKKGESFDKDLWRVGKDADVIVGVWQTLFQDLVR
jgi:phosphoribosylaminoimidazole-succinocarboxamide synthase